MIEIVHSKITYFWRLNTLEYQLLLTKLNNYETEKGARDNFSAQLYSKRI